ncbi:IpaD/SipD/SspD family type III secretion system needle tip protein [Pectobacterium parvum]|uniref:IpaD/SipD/SspD family type III secretion system needle tip protein n=1 Tax=Pectobacterium parvum TaxID=2778550 RepID=A0AAP9IEJ2_9GAMM|nr:MULTISPECIES: IpaD/SipD/SspD family type III secretion system needle tip protein [Pectobacterium]GKW40846.1 hypothetical protein PEC301879_07050 [Pectobacterium carotovorum subsp. carotovorum]MCU1800724.1 IpaD/SipD/SspD family type III secretion system needle tip protein [Pectobacterium parvum]QHQ23260.1 IpaD/SipD/SspD family type III secretion system needle tip protein [Pectobacterium parvum]UFK38922.1 IpaD/SipD/SspD family type III secretion system needle tip protein [Pectobacterium parvum
MNMTVSLGQVSVPVYIQTGLNEPHITSYTEPAPIANSTLLKTLLSILASSNSKNSSKAFGESPEMHSLDIGEPVLKRSKMGSALLKMRDAFDKNAECSDSADGAAFKAKAIYLEKECARAVEDIRHEISLNKPKVTFAYNQLSIAIAKINMAEVTEVKDELEQVNGNGKRDGEFTTGTSYAELWATIANAIRAIKEDYVDFYADLMLQYTEMYEEYNKCVQLASSKAVSAGEDGNTVGFDMGCMREGYTDFDRYVQDHSPAGNVKNWDKMTQEEKDDMRATLEPAYHVEDDGAIIFNLDQYDKAVKNTYPSYLNITITDDRYYPSTASYQAWLATFNSSGSALQSNMQSFAQRYSQANSIFDNLNKALSGTISSLGESAKDVFKSL